MDVFRRPELAARLVDMLMSPSSASAVPSGLFLAAPRRTGKSTFLVEDLAPALESGGALVLYVDLWSERRQDPAVLIARAVAAAVSRREVVLGRLRKIASLEAVSVGAVSLSWGGDAAEGSVPLGEALRALSADAGRPVVLIIDEAQHAITTPAGVDALFALKSARDALGRSGEQGLRIVATGSNRDKLAMLRGTKDQAFFGAPLVPFPMLDQRYLEWFLDRNGLAEALDIEAAHRLFVRAGYRPEILGAAADALRFELEPDARPVPERFASFVDERLEEADAIALREVRSLTALQSAVLREMAASGEAFAPFEAATLERYRARMASLPEASGTVVPSVSNVQGALAALQERSLAWRAARGVYALEDSGLAPLMAKAGMLEPLPGQ